MQPKDQANHSIQFEQLEFSESDGLIKAVFQKYYTFLFNKQDLGLHNLTVEKKSITASADERSLRNALNKVLNNGFDRLKNTVTGRPCKYIHKNSGIPLIGTNIFGIVDRDTNCIEIKPLTGCNLGCIYCSVDEGNYKDSKKLMDFFVEKEYLVQELEKLVRMKKKTDKGIELHIGPQGEPLLYPELASLIKDISRNPEIKRISMDTNGLLLNQKLIDELVNAGLSRFNISLNSMNKETCNRLSNRKYNLDHLLKMIRYIDEKYSSKGLCEIIIAPVIVPGYNDSEEEMDALIKFANALSGMSNGVKLGIQNFLSYKRGRLPAESIGWKKFYDMLKGLESKHKTKLLLNADDFLIEKNAVLQKPFIKGDSIKARIVSQGSYKGEVIAEAKGRCIMVHDCDEKSAFLKVRIVRDKHNIFEAKPL